VNKKDLNWKREVAMTTERRDDVMEDETHLSTLSLQLLKVFHVSCFARTASHVSLESDCLSCSQSLPHSTGNVKFFKSSERVLALFSFRDDKSIRGRETGNDSCAMFSIPQKKRKK